MLVVQVFSIDWRPRIAYGIPATHRDPKTSSWLPDAINRSDSDESAAELSIDARRDDR